MRPHVFVRAPPTCTAVGQTVKSRSAECRVISAPRPSTAGSHDAQRDRTAGVPAPSPHVHVRQEMTEEDQTLDVIQSMESWMGKMVEPMLVSPSTCWQPQDFLPEASSPDFLDAVQQLQAGSKDLPPEYLVVLVGDMVTEEALPSYMSMLNRLQGTADESGADDSSWARWTRGWTSEENRHGDLLNKYLYLSGQVDMRSVESTVQHLIGSGFDPQLRNHPYHCFVYTSFQERATKISHRNTARLASEYGDATLTQICDVIAKDEARHEAAYQKIVDELFRRDPEGAMAAFADMMRTSIVMPAHLLNDGSQPAGCGATGGASGGASRGAGAGRGPSASGAATQRSKHPEQSPLFSSFATVAERLGVYSAADYSDIVHHLVHRWRISEVSGLSGEAAEAQEYLCNLPQRMERMAAIHRERSERALRRGKTQDVQFSWIHNKTLTI